MGKALLKIPPLSKAEQDTYEYGFVWLRELLRKIQAEAIQKGGQTVVCLVDESDATMDAVLAAGLLIPQTPDQSLLPDPSSTDSDQGSSAQRGHIVNVDLFNTIADLINRGVKVTMQRLIVSKDDTGKVTQVFVNGKAR